MNDKPTEEPRLSVKLDALRDQMVDIRREMNELERAGLSIKYLGGFLTCGIVALYHEVDEARKIEVKRDDEKLGRSVCFQSRGIGMDTVPCCFVCGATTRDPDKDYAYMHNIAVFFDDADEALLREWFNGRLRVDRRSHEPGYVQMKLGTCNKHLPNLRRLDALAGAYGRLRQCDVDEALTLPDSECCEEAAPPPLPGRNGLTAAELLARSTVTVEACEQQAVFADPVGLEVQP